MPSLLSTFKMEASAVLPPLGKEIAVFLLSVSRIPLGVKKGCVILLWHSLFFPNNYFDLIISVMML